MSSSVSFSWKNTIEALFPSEVSYTADYFNSLDRRSLRSAAVVVPIVMELIGPRSVVDVGCGTGAWLSRFLDAGVSDIVGVDGDYVDRGMLRFPPERFVAHDLEKSLTLGRSFDLVISLEVAEHLSLDAGERLIDSLVSLGPVVLFSAAVPGQGGHGHLNEQWPVHWAELFATRGYEAIDCIRHRIWDNPDVDWWYAQNTILYVAASRAIADQRLRSELDQHGGCPRALVHPRPAIVRALRRRAISELTDVLEPSDECALIDEGGLPDRWEPPCKFVPFMDQDGSSWGIPRDDDRAIQQLSLLQRDGATHLVVTWSCFWWRDAYPSFFEYLDRHFTKVLWSDAVILFELTREPRDG